MNRSEIETDRKKKLGKVVTRSDDLGKLAYSVIAPIGFPSLTSPFSHHLENEPSVTWADIHRRSHMYIKIPFLYFTRETILGPIKHLWQRHLAEYGKWTSQVADNVVQFLLGTSTLYSVSIGGRVSRGRSGRGKSWISNFHQK